MRTQVVLLAVCVGLLVPATAHAAPALHGSGLRTQVAFDADLLDLTSRVQVLTSLCTVPGRIRGCSPMPDRMRTALARALGVPVAWVEERRPRGPRFLVFAPVEFDGREARAEVAYWEPAGDGCRGGAATTYRKQRGAWTWDVQIAWIACPAT